MKNIQLLDCTLRDGGYINDWEFGCDDLVSIFERMVSAGVDIIETGFINESRSFDANRSIMPDTDSVQKIYGRVDKQGAMVVGMIDYGTCGLDKLTPCKDSYLDGIRVIFKKHLMKEAIAFCEKVKKPSQPLNNWDCLTACALKMLPASVRLMRAIILCIINYTHFE